MYVFCEFIVQSNMVEKIDKQTNKTYKKKTIGKEIKFIKKWRWKKKSYKINKEINVERVKKLKRILKKY